MLAVLPYHLRAFVLWAVQGHRLYSDASCRVTTTEVVTCMPLGGTCRPKNRREAVDPSILGWRYNVGTPYSVVSAASHSSANYAID